MRLLLPPDRGAVRGAARAAVLADWMSQWLDTRVEVELAPTYSALALQIERGLADVAWAPPAVCARVRAAPRSILTVVRYGRSECAAALVVRRDADVHRLEDLRSTRAAWVDPLSTSGHLLALAHLTERGLDPERLFAQQRFSGSYRNALLEVARGRADVTSVFVVAQDEEMTLRELNDIVGPIARSLRLLETTSAAPFDGLLIGRDAPAELEERVLSLEQSRGAPSILLEVCRADRFVVADADAYARFERFCDAFLT